MEEGAWRRPSAYSDEPDVFTRALIEDGRKHLLLGGMIRTGCPTVVLQGMRDEDVPYAHALALMERLGGDPATLTLIKDGDHRLSRPQDLRAAVRRAGADGRSGFVDATAGRVEPPHRARLQGATLYLTPYRCRLAPCALSQASARLVSGKARRTRLQNFGEWFMWTICATSCAAR